ncbi:MAG: alanine--glyoxylate aminotransferase family protein [Methanomassiliicoccaceae archaeon]|jgi:aspartate aminotransferase-like enzyme|nr:alanine--glyoxylate aminotransferase family protein [Methanomassiliicoccaceae archaeon]
MALSIREHPPASAHAKAPNGGKELDRKLFTVGPVHVDPEILKAQTRPMITHRSKEYKALHASVIERLKKALDTDMDIFLVAGSASAFLEGAVRNGVKSNVLGITNGSFGDRWIDISKANGKNVKEIRVPWGKPILPASVEGAVDDSIEAVHFVSNESSTGVLSPLGDMIDSIKKQNDPLIFVDGVTSVAATDLQLRKNNVDALVFGSQKALGLPPGLGFIAVSEKLMKKAKEVQNRGFYTDLIKIKKNNDENSTLTTSPVSLVYALDLQLDRMLAEGMAARYRRHREMAGIVRTWSSKLHGMLPEEKYSSDTIGVLNRGDLDFDKFHASLKAKGYEISNGYGEVKQRTFRIGHMGDVTPATLRELLKAMDETLEEFK